MISISSVVICDWRARLNVRFSVRPRSLAFSVAAFMATMRMICSLTAASMNDWKSIVLTALGSRSFRSSSAEGENSYRAPPTVAALPSVTSGFSGSSCMIVGRWRAIDSNDM